VNSRSRPALIALIVVVVSGCGGGNPIVSRDDPAEIHYLGTEILYHEMEGKKDHSMVLVLATWCGYCTRLKNETLTDSSVIAILHESFNVVAIDPDSDSLVVHGDSTVTSKVFARNIYGIRGYPSMIFLDRQGEELGIAAGYRPPADFVSLLELVLRDYPADRSRSRSVDSNPAVPIR